MKVLIVIDMQNDFIDGALGSNEAKAIVPYVKHKINQYKELGNPVYYTLDTHTSGYLSTLEGRNLPIEHCIRETNGWQISKELDTSDCVLFEKPTFGSVSLAQYMKEHHAKDEFEFVGVCTDICVISNVMLLKAYLPENRIVVDALGCAGVTEESHKNALMAMKACHIEIKENE